MVFMVLANAFKSDSPVDSGFQNLLDSGFHINADSGFQSTGFWIPIAKISWIPDSVKWGRYKVEVHTNIIGSLNFKQTSKQVV